MSFGHGIKVISERDAATAGIGSTSLGHESLATKRHRIHKTKRATKQPRQFCVVCEFLWLRKSHLPFGHRFQVVRQPSAAAAGIGWMSFGHESLATKRHRIHETKRAIKQPRQFCVLCESLWLEKSHLPFWGAVSKPFLQMWHQLIIMHS